MRNFSKKLLAVLLSALMVVTTMPFSALTAFADDDAAITAYNTAVAAYASKMDGTIYTNMGTAYAAFVDANEAYDAYVYGQGTASALSSAASTLSTATSALSDTWTYETNGYTSTVTPTFGNTTVNNSNYYANILYGTANADTLDITEKNARFIIRHAENIVVYYDGKTTPVIPVETCVQRTTSSNRYIYTLYVTDGTTGSSSNASNSTTNNNTQIYLKGVDDDNFAWRGTGAETASSSTAAFFNTAIAGGYKIGADAANSYGHYSVNLYRKTGTASQKYNVYGSALKVGSAIESDSSFATNGYKSFNLTWQMYAGSNETNTATDIAGSGTESTTINVINYKALLDAIDTYKAYLADVDTTCANGGASDVITALDTATNFDLGSYNYAGAASAAGSVIASTLNKTVTEDGDGYANLRTAINRTKSEYNYGNDDSYYTASLWATFTSAYENARDNMTNLTSNGYSTSAAAQTLADRLNTAYESLINSKQVVDTAELETAIDDAQYAVDNSAYFTSGSYSNAALVNVISAAKVAVWTSEDGYKIQRKKGNTTEETVAAQLTYVQNAVKKLVISKDATVSTVGGYSATTAIAYANDTSVFTPADYANWNTVTTAIAAANSFDGAITSYETNCAKNKITAYQTVVRNIISALNNLKVAFSKMENGQLIAAGSITDAAEAVGSPDSLGAGQDFKTRFWGYTDSVVFRTTHDAAYLPLPDSYIDVWTQSGYPVGLDAINIDDTCHYTNSNGNGQITSGGNETDQSVSSDTINNNTMAGGLNATNEGTDAKRGNFVLGSATMSGTSTPDGFGIFVNASKVASISNSVYAIDADGTMHNTTESVSNDNYFTTDLTTNLGTFDNIDNHKNNSNYGAYGAVWASNNGTTEMKASTSLYVLQETSNRLSATTKLTVDTYNFSDKQFGAYLWWKYMNVNTFGYTYHGFRHDWNSTNYNRTVKVVNIADLFRLIEQCENAGYVESEYTNSSWGAYSSALAAAKADMDYSDKSAEWVLEQCQGRYDDLWAAKEALVKAADRSALITARDAVKDVYDAGQSSDTYGGPWSDESWTAFADYYENQVIAYLNGIYSATGVRDYQYYDATGTTKSTAQQDIETRAARIVELREALQSNADFTPLDTAVATLRTTIEGGAFTTASLSAVADALDAIDYFKLTEAQRQAIYASAQATADIQAAADAVDAAAALLVAVDADVVSNAGDISSAATAYLETCALDPDAFDYDAVQEFIDNLVVTNNVDVFDTPYYGDLAADGYNYQTMAQINGEVYAALSANTKTYTVTITGVDDAAATEYEYTIGGTDYTATGATLSEIPYGTEVRIYAPNSKYVNWYYTYASSTAGNSSEKYLTNDNVINFVVKGDATFRLDNQTDIAQGGNTKVTYANNLRNTSYLVEYVEIGSQITLPEAPAIAYYNFTGYTVDDEDKAVGDTITINKETVIIANYEYSSDNGFYISVYNLNNDLLTGISAEVEYNQKIEITQAGLKTTTPYITVDGTQIKGTRNKYYKGDSIYAYIVIKGGNIDVFDAYFDDETGTAEKPDGTATILTYEQDYTFYANEDMYIIPLTEDEYNEAMGNFSDPEAEDNIALINTDSIDENGASAFASETMINTGEKLSIVSNYVLPNGATLVETGILFTATVNGTIPSADLTFKTVGTNGVTRMKSTQQTVGNQFVISPIRTASLSGKTVNAKYAAYVIYKDSEGNTHQFISNAVNSSATIA